MDGVCLDGQKRGWKKKRERREKKKKKKKEGWRDSNNLACRSGTITTDNWLSPLRTNASDQSKGLISFGGEVSERKYSVLAARWRTIMADRLGGNTLLGGVESTSDCTSDVISGPIRMKFWRVFELGGLDNANDGGFLRYVERSREWISRQEFNGAATLCRLSAARDE